MANSRTLSDWPNWQTMTEGISTYNLSLESNKAEFVVGIGIRQSFGIWL
jgi:hypothetical protein